MSDDHFAEWFRRRGVKVVRTDGTCWAQLARGVFQAIPYHHILNLREEELKGFFRTHKAVALRYSAPLTASQGNLSYHVILDDSAYDINHLQKKARYDVRRGLEGIVIERIGFDRLATEGWALRSDTLARQGRRGAETCAWWGRLCKSAESLTGFESWAAIRAGAVVASVILFIGNGCCSILYHQSLTSEHQSGVNNALAYSVVREMFSRGTVNKIFYGLQSLDAPASVDQFKFRMAFSALPVRQRIVFHPVIEPLVNSLTLRSVEALHGLLKTNVTISKIKGMMSFYVQGNIAFAEQNWPDWLKRRLHRTMSSQFEIRDASIDDVDDLAHLHVNSFSNFFLSFLGLRFLRLLYTEILSTPGHAAFVAADETDKPQAFVVGVQDQVATFNRLARTRWFAFALASYGAVIRRPSIVLRLLRALGYPKLSKLASARCLLMSIAVSPAFKGMGVGKRLVIRFLEAMKSRGEKAVCLTTDMQNNDPVNLFYQGLGFEVGRTFTTPEGRWMNEYWIDLTAWDAGHMPPPKILHNVMPSADQEI